MVLLVLLALRNVVDVMLVSSGSTEAAAAQNMNPEVLLSEGIKTNSHMSPCPRVTCPVLLSVLQGVCMLFLPRIGLTLFIVFYTFGNICALGRSVSTAMKTKQPRMKTLMVLYQGAKV